MLQLPISEHRSPTYLMCILDLIAVETATTWKSCTYYYYNTWLLNWINSMKECVNRSYNWTATSDIISKERPSTKLSQNETKWKFLLHGNHLNCKQPKQSRGKGRNQAFKRSLPCHMIFLNFNKREIWVEWCIQQQQNSRQQTSCENDQFSWMQGWDQGAKESPFGISVPLQRPLF